MKHPNLRTLLGATLLAGVTACSSTSGGDISKSGSDLTYLHVSTNAPALCADSVGGWAHKGGADFQLTLSFNTIQKPCPDGKPFLQLKLDKDAMVTLPNGTPINTGDSVFISVVWAGGDSVLFHMEPTGLVLDPSNAAELHIDYGESEDAGDSTIIRQVAIWRQPTLTDHFTKLQSVRHEDSEEIEARLNGFSRYALAY